MVKVVSIVLVCAVAAAPAQACRTRGYFYGGRSATCAPSAFYTYSSSASYAAPYVQAPLVQAPLVQAPLMQAPLVPESAPCQQPRTYSAPEPYQGQYSEGYSGYFRGGSYGTQFVFRGGYFRDGYFRGGYFRGGHSHSTVLRGRIFDGRPFPIASAAGRGIGRVLRGPTLVPVGRGVFARKGALR